VVAAWVTASGMRKRRSEFLIHASLMTVLWFAFAYITGLGSLIYSASMYAITNASINLTAYGAYWFWSWRGVGGYSGWQYELLRISWIFVPLYAVIRFDE